MEVPVPIKEKSKINYPPYEEGVDWFSLFCTSEEELFSYDYKVAPVLVCWSTHLEGLHAKKIDDRFFYKMYCGNLYKKMKHGNHSFKNDMQLMYQLNKPPLDERIWCFLTLGFNDETITPASMLRVSKLVFEKPWVASGSLMCLERFRRCKETGKTVVHHHTHLLIVFNEKIPPSRIIDETFKTAGMKYIMRDKNCVDYLGPQKPKKTYQPYEKYYDYVRGIKTAEKMPYVEMDRLWRQEKKIDNLYEK